MSDNDAVNTRTERVAVLLVEDDARVRAGLRDWLAATFQTLSFREAGTGEEAVALAQVQPPDIVLMDIGLPGMTGIEATRRITALAPQGQVIMLSIHEDPEYRADATAAGASAYVAKRTMHTELVSTISRLLLFRAGASAGGGVRHDGPGGQSGSPAESGLQGMGKPK